MLDLLIGLAPVTDGLLFFLLPSWVPIPDFGVSETLPRLSSKSLDVCPNSDVQTKSNSFMSVYLS